MRLHLVYLLTTVMLTSCDQHAPVSTPNPTPIPPPVPAIVVETPDANGLITAVNHVRAGTILYHPNGEKIGEVTGIARENPVNHQPLQTVLWRSQYGPEVVPMKYMDMYRVRPDGK